MALDFTCPRQRNRRSKRRLGYTVDPETGCWNWAGKLVNGYGRVVEDGKWLRAHRYIWERFRGEIPKGQVLDHLCRNRACVNPDHLEPVSRAENVRRGCLTNGLSWATVRAIRKAYKPYIITCEMLAVAYGLSVRTIQSLVSNERWVEVSD